MRGGSISEISKGEKITDQRLDLFRRLFAECDVDGSGSIDKDGTDLLTSLHRTPYDNAEAGG